MWFTRVSIANPVLATMVMLAFVVLGVFSYQRLKVDQFPDIEFPIVVVQVDYPGASPEIVETEVSKKIEEAVNSIAGINELYSRSYDGSSVVIIQFNLDVDGRKAAEDVREKIAAIRPTLRDEVEEPRVLRFDPASRPIYTLALTSPDGSRSPVDLTTYADQVVKKRLENVRGVGSVTLVGGVKREINIYLRPDAMEALGVSVDQVISAVRTENQDLPAGALRSLESERVVQVTGRLQRPEDFKQIVVARKVANGSIVPVKLWQVADVVDGPQELESLALYNGQRTLALDVLKAQGENTIDVVDGLNAVVEALRPELPPGMAVEVVRDNARPIRVAVQNVRQTLIEGAVLTVLIVFLFLNSWRSTVITGLTLPIALIGTFLFMYWFGFSINMITLMALSLCVGLLIDDAIVVRENIVRHAQMGKDARQAALDGTQEIGLAVLATTLSIVAVFLPIGFMGGIIGRFFHQFGITIVAAVLISMFVSFTLDPMLSSVWHDPAVHGGSGGKPASLYDRTLGRLTAAVDRFSHWLGEVYHHILGWSLKRKAATLGIALATLVASFALVPVLGTEFVPKADFSETTVSFYTPAGSSIEVTEAKARQVDAILREYPEVRYTLMTINTGAAQGKNYATAYVRLVDRDQRTRDVDRMSVELRERLARVPGITVTHVGLLDPVGGQKPISLSIQGTDLQELQRLTRDLLARLREIPGLVDIDTSMKDDKPTVDVNVRREAAADLGLGVGSITATLRALVAGETTGNWRAADDQSYDVKVRLRPDSRQALADIARLGLTVPAADGSTRIVRLSQVADVVPSSGPTQINRRDLSREVEITANVSGRSLGEVSADIRRVLAEQAFPPGYRSRFGGSTKDMQESFGYALSALALAVIFIYMILASQFKSFLQPIALMSSLPLTLIGVVLILLLFRSSLNLFSIIGVIMLMGLVTKNAILLVDFANRAREGHSAEGLDGRQLDREAALLMAARVRLRPIMMTTLAMVFGMVPLAFALTEGSEQRAPMGQAVIGGVITSSLLTLVVVPVVYCYLDDLGTWLKRKLGGRGAPAAQVLTGEAK
ncbi:efflux RND transporter permease subunit [Caldimonas thermodepolymerans]|uniref:HAE1 family hydrophobic/amphiphilic exporter-1 n=1 Tax=Caldimonas thermodepolymerans TaxID=215580 RepID=A0AA46DFB5_9BURK|nr:efflux RND transporter permease subunit [Caldimonas thermodepolymerans]TCP08536.1 HAE1 family hydrophobic/amphiphilic exporter-1 [Caldimonas thermodepolymerans]UZG46866.1 efflux RND transporter permease subunit [Caldimonas thermodepolymerans]